MTKVNKKPPAKVEAHNGPKGKGVLKHIGGSKFDKWNATVANQATRAVWSFTNIDADTKERERTAAVEALIGIGPQDELEGMLGAQLVACHNASMECFRRAMVPQQTPGGWQESLNQASKLSRTYAALLDTLNRHRGKGQQKVTVEHVHVYEGGQAIVGTVEHTGGGGAEKLKDQPHALGYAPSPTMPSPNPTWEPLPVTRDEEWPVSDARGSVAGPSEGK
jgi:hypothetical protein